MLNVGLGKTRLTRKEVAKSVLQQTSKACFLQILNKSASTHNGTKCQMAI